MEEEFYSVEFIANKANKANKHRTTTNKTTKKPGIKETRRQSTGAARTPHSRISYENSKITNR